MKAFSEVYSKKDEKRLEGSLGIGTVYEHIKTGAKIFTIKNDDINKVFLVGFRTTPEDDTGVPHIMEHSVLCGSGKFPLKDPFVELVKGSLNTFLNAMTYPDKTVYPVASCNDQDFRNLMDVYLDAVFDPDIYRERKIFEQEGWHYELNDQGELIYNGVVYNEMKGAFSSPDAVLERRTMHALFPDTTYGFESGGDPDCIPSLTYEDFLDFHRTYYHPSNSYIYLYGDMDMEERLLWIDENYLRNYDRKEVDSAIGLQKAFSAPVSGSWYYPIGDEESEERHTYLSRDYVVGGALDPLLNNAFQILSFLLLDAPGAPLSEALIKAGIGEDILGGYQNGIRQPYFSIVAKNADLGDRERFDEIIDGTLRKLAREGINKQSILAAINYSEFKTREADFGRTPAGLVYGLNAFDSWLYDADPMMHLHSLEILNELKEKAKGRYFEELIEKYLIDNDFSASIDIIPKKGLLAENEKRDREKLDHYRDSLSEEELSAIRKEACDLKAYQNEKNSPEDLLRIPLLSLSDIPRELPGSGYPEAFVEGKCIRAAMDSNGIAYIRVLFDTSGLSEDELQLASFLSYILGELNTSRHTYSELSDLILLNTGGLDLDTVSYPRAGGSGDHQGFVYLDFRVLKDRIDLGFDIGLEIIRDTLFDDAGRIGEKLNELKSRMQARIDGASHVAAVTRASSYFDRSARFDDLTEGIAFYDFLSAASKLYREPVHQKRFLDSVLKIAEKLFVRERTSFYAACDDELYFIVKPAAERFLSALPEKGRSESGDRDEKLRDIRPAGRLNEGIKTTSMVNYVARAGSFSGLPYKGELSVLKVLLNYEYLWQNLRVKGGAYGCMSGFARSGKAYLVSYRDPEVAKTDGIYRELPQYLRTLRLDERDINKYIIGAISETDRPLTYSMKARDAISAFMSGVTREQRQKEREEILDCTCEKLRELAPYAERLIAEDYNCTIGNAGAITRDASGFRTIRELYL